MEYSTYFESALNDCQQKLFNLSDCKLHTDDGYWFPAHKLILATKSKYFFAMFCDFEEETPEVSIPDMKGQILGNILSYIYTGELNVTEDNFCDLMVASDYLLLEDILAQLKTVLEKNLNINNCAAIFAAANRINQPDILRDSFRFLETHFEEIVRRKRETICQLPLEELKQLLNDTSLRVSGEKAVWLAIVDWVEAHSPRSLPIVPELLMCLAVEEVDEHLATEILNHDIVAKNEFCRRTSEVHSCSSKARFQLQLFELYVAEKWKPRTLLYSHRKPPNLHFISHTEVGGATHIYVTYDQKIDLWRKVIEVRPFGGFTTQFIALKGSIYVFKSERQFHRYNVVEKEWKPCKDFRRLFPTFVTMGRFIYLLGGLSVYPFRELSYDVRIYDTETDNWYDAAPMHPVKYFSSVVLGDCIYVVGIKPNSYFEMIVQAYDSHRGRWRLHPAPRTARERPSLVAYCGKIYAVGGGNGNSLRKVDVFDPAQDAWYAAESLPYEYRSAKAFVLNGCLIVSGVLDSEDEANGVYSTVMLNLDGKRWEDIEGPSSHSVFNRYTFQTLDDSEGVKAISKENRDPTTVFEASPFAEICL